MSSFYIYLTLTTSNPAEWPTTSVTRFDSAAKSYAAALDDVLTRNLGLLDPFQAPLINPTELCGPTRTLASAVDLIADMAMATNNFPDYSIHDDVVMDYWESIDDELYWTPLCSARHDTVRL